MIGRYAALLIGLLLGLTACGTIGNTYHLDEGETLPADQHLAVVEANLAQGSLVEGNLNISASEVQVNGQIRGDLTVVASNLIIGDHAVIEGDLIYCTIQDGNFHQSEMAEIGGVTKNQCPHDETSLLLPRAPQHNTLIWLGFTIFLSLGAGLTAALGMIFFPGRMDQISLVAHEHPLAAVGFGALTLLTGLALTALYLLLLRLVVTIALMPIFLIGWVVLGLLIAFGSISVAQPFGVWLLRRWNFDQRVPVISATIGASGLTFFIMISGVLETLLIVPLVGGLLIGVWGLGAVLLTRFGTRYFRPDPVSQPLPAAKS